MINTSDGRSFSTQDVNLMLAFSIYVRMAAENAKSLGAVERCSQQVSASIGISLQLAQATNMEEFLVKLMEGTCATTECDYFAIFVPPSNGFSFSPGNEVLRYNNKGDRGVRVKLGKGTVIQTAGALNGFANLCIADQERGPAVWEQWYKDKYKRLKDLERAVRCQDLQDMREPQISKGTAKLAAKRPDADKKVYERLYAYQDKYRENRENLVREEEERFSGTGTGTARPPSTQYERTRRAAERRRARAYEDDDGGYTETPSQLFSTVNAESHERQPFTPAVNDHSTQIVRQKQERALQMAQGPDSHRSYGSTPRVYGTEVAPRVVDKKHQRSKEEWNSMVNSFKRDFDS